MASWVAWAGAAVSAATAAAPQAAGAAAGCARALLLLMGRIAAAPTPRGGRLRSRAAAALMLAMQDLPWGGCK